MVFRGRDPRIQPLSALPNIHQIYAYAWFLLNSHFMEPAVHTSCYIIYIYIYIYYMCVCVFFGFKRSLAYFSWYQLNRSKMDDTDTWDRIFNEVFQFLCFSPQKHVKTWDFWNPKVDASGKNPHGFYPAAATQQLGHRPGNIGLGRSGSWVQMMSLGSHLPSGNLT